MRRQEVSALVIGGYLEHLTEADLNFLLRATGAPAAVEAASELRSRPDLVERLLADPGVHAHLFGNQARSDPLLGASPFLAFAVLVQRCAEELDDATFVDEWVGPRRRLPVFDVAELRQFLDDRTHRLFLAELLASYTHVASGAMWVRHRRGWRRQRFSELDPVRLASLLDVVGEEDRPGIYRRLGDLALFLTGVFPDRSASWTLSPIDAARLQRAAAASLDVSDGRASIGLLEQLGERWYRLACATARAPQSYGMQAVASIAGRFGHARRILNLVADRYLFPFRSRWFPRLG